MAKLQQNNAKQPTIAALKRERTRRLARLGANVYYLRRRHKEQEMYDLVCNEFVALGGVYVKFLQGVLFNTQVMKRWHSPNRLRIFENLDYEPMDIIQLLRDELPPEQLSNVVLVNPEPFAAGSFGQVYLGQHANGKRIIIKVLRPMIRELLKYDLRLLMLFSRRFASKQYTNIAINMDSAIKEFRDATLSETDYVTEAQFGQELFDAYKNHPQIVIPETYLGLCTPHIIVQEYVGGISGVTLLRLKDQGYDPKQYIQEQLGSDLELQLEALGVENLIGAFRLPRVQGDPHPGNIRLLPDNKVGMIDFGISAPAPANKAAFFGVIDEWSRLFKQNSSIANIFEQFMRFFVNDLYRALKKISTLVPQPSSSQPEQEQANQTRQQSTDLMKEVGRIVQNMFDSATGARDLQSVLNDGRLLQAFGQMVNKNNRLGLVIRLESSEILRASQTYIAFLETLGLRAELLPRILASAVQQVEQLYPEIVNETDSAVSMSQAIDIVNRWLERIAVKDPALFAQLMSHINVRPAPKTPAATSQQEGTSHA